MLNVNGAKVNEEGVVSVRVSGTLQDGRAIDAVLSLETDGREAWWEEGELPFNAGGVDPGDEDTGWDEVLNAIDESGALEDLQA